jgi:hypothetical protein
MDATTTVRVVSGVIFVILLFILIKRRRNKIR